MILRAFAEDRVKTSASSGLPTCGPSWVYR